MLCDNAILLVHQTEFLRNRLCWLLCEPLFSSCKICRFIKISQGGRGDFPELEWIGPQDLSLGPWWLSFLLFSWPCSCLAVSVGQLYLCFLLRVVGSGCLAPNSDVPHSTSALFGTSPSGEMQWRSSRRPVRGSQLKALEPFTVFSGLFLLSPVLWTLARLDCLLRGGPSSLSLSGWDAFGRGTVTPDFFQAMWLVFTTGVWTQIALGVARCHGVARQG